MAATVDRGRVQMTDTTPCGIVTDGHDVCLVCASTTCPRAHHDGRTCSGGCTPCRCGRGAKASQCI